MYDVHCFLLGIKLLPLEYMFHGRRCPENLKNIHFVYIVARVWDRLRYMHKNENRFYVETAMHSQ